MTTHARRGLPLFGLLAMLAAAPAAAQDLGTPPPQDGEVETVMEDGGLTGTISFEGRLEDLGIAIPAFATDRDAPTPTSAGSTAALGVELGQVVFNNLRRNGLFKPSGPDALPRPASADISAPLTRPGAAAGPRCWCRAMCAAARMAG